MIILIFGIEEYDHFQFSTRLFYYKLTKYSKFIYTEWSIFDRTSIIVLINQSHQKKFVKSDFSFENLRFVENKLNSSNQGNFFFKIKNKNDSFIAKITLDY